MTPEKKRRLRNIAILSLLGLIGGTMAFQAFNQQAINDRENTIQVNVGGRVHDYYNRDTENKDVFVENYGERPIMARIRLSEFLEYQRGEEDFTPLVPGSERNNLATWITWIPSANNINQRANTGNSSAFNRYAQLTFGWSREGETAPWYMPTFNHDNLDLRTSAAGHARIISQAQGRPMGQPMAPRTLGMVQMPTGQVGIPLITVQGYGRGLPLKMKRHKTCASNVPQ